MEYSAGDGKYTYYIFAGTKSVAEESNGKKIFYHCDHLGSTRALTDQDRKLVGLCKYDAWGKIESTNEYDAGVVNGDFELTNSLGVQGWTAVNDNPVLADCVYLQTGGLNGSAGLKITRNNSGDTAYWARRNLFVSPDTDYVLTGYFLSGNAQSTKAHAQLVYHDAQGNILKIDDTGTLGYSGSWKAFTLSSHSPANAATMEIWLTEDGDQGMAVFFDGVKLKVPGLAGKYDFTGKREDEGTGLEYFGARFYDPETGRFMTADTYTFLPNDDRGLFNIKSLDDILEDGLDNPQKQNRYVYCLNNPVNRIDADGHFAAALAVFAIPGVGQAALVAAVVTLAVVAVVVVVESIHDAVKKAEHTKNKRKSTENKHEKGQTRQKRDKGNEKGDERRPYRKSGKNTGAIAGTDDSNNNDSDDSDNSNSDNSSENSSDSSDSDNSDSNGNSSNGNDSDSDSSSDSGY